MSVRMAIRYNREKIYINIYTLEKIELHRSNEHDTLTSLRKKTKQEKNEKKKELQIPNFNDVCKKAIKKKKKGKKRSCYSSFLHFPCIATTLPYFLRFSFILLL